MRQALEYLSSGEQDRLLVSQRDTAYQPRATPWVASTASPGVLKERRISVNGGCVLNPTVCGVPSERRMSPSDTQGSTLGWYAPPLRGGSCHDNPAWLLLQQTLIQ